MNRPVAALLLAALALCATPGSTQAPGTLDPGFGTAGKAVVDVPIGGNPRSNIAFDVAIQADGRIVMSGSSSLIGGATGPERMVAVRLLAGGGPDGSFGTSGIARIDGNPGGSDNTRYYDGRVELAPGGGLFLFHGTDANPVGWVLAKLTAAGGLDSTFSGDGRVIVSAADLGAGDIAIQPDGRPIVLDDFLDTAPNPDHQQMTVSRRLVSGGPDTSFGDEGFRDVQFDLGTLRNDWARVALLQPDGGILVGGRAEASAANSDFALARLTAGGDLDATFGGGDGKVTLSFDLPIGNYDEARALAVDDRGRIWIGGIAGDGSSNNEAALARLLPNGTPDPGFSGDGKLTFSFNAPANASWDQIFGLALQGDGRVLAAGRATNATGGGRWFGVARIREDGTLDPTFAGDGTTAFNTASGSGSISVGRAVALAADGRILVVGGGETAPQDMAFVAARLHNDYIFADGFELGSTADWSLLVD